MALIIWDYGLGVNVTEIDRQQKQLILKSGEKIIKKDEGRHIINKLLGFLLACVIGSILSSCTGGDHLSHGEAKKIIAAHFKYPIIVSKQIDVREKGSEVLQFLKNEGYIAVSPIRTCCGDCYPTTEKGKPYFGDIIKNFSTANLSFNCGYSKRVIKSIEEIVIDKQTNSATVRYVEGLEPNEPIFSSIIKKSQREGKYKS